MLVNLHNYLSHTNALGPYTRTAIWFQGCPRRCVGCMTPESQSSDGGYHLSVDLLFEKIKKEKNIEGITVSGGDPFYQIESLYHLLNRIKNETDLGVIIYTGYYLQELIEMNDTRVNKIIMGLADLIIDGPYIDSLNDGKATLRGSSNQQVHFVTDRYKKHADLYNSNNRVVEIVSTNNSISIVGVPNKEVLQSYKDGINRFIRRNHD